MNFIEKIINDIRKAYKNAQHAIDEGNRISKNFDTEFYNPNSESSVKGIMNLADDKKSTVTKTVISSSKRSYVGVNGNTINIKYSYKSNEGENYVINYNGRNGVLQITRNLALLTTNSEAKLRDLEDAISEGNISGMSIPIPYGEPVQIGPVKKIQYLE